MAVHDDANSAATKIKKLAVLEGQKKYNNQLLH